jgi:hypothetical protein
MVTNSELGNGREGVLSELFSGCNLTEETSFKIFDLSVKFRTRGHPEQEAKVRTSGVGYLWSVFILRRFQLIRIIRVYVQWLVKQGYERTRWWPNASYNGAEETCEDNQPLGRDLTAWSSGSKDSHAGAHTPADGRNVHCTWPSVLVTVHRNIMRLVRMRTANAQISCEKPPQYYYTNCHSISRFLSLFSFDKNHAIHTNILVITDKRESEKVQRL